MIKILYTLIILIILAIIIIYMYNFFKTIEEFTTTVYVDYQPTNTKKKYGITCQKILSRVYSCGYNSSGQLGLGDNKNRESPEIIKNFANITAVSAGYKYSLFLHNNGKVYSCGESDKLGYTEYIKKPTLINYFNVNKIIITAISVSIGDTQKIMSFHSLYLDSSGRVYSSGWNKYGQLGLGNAGDDTNRESPELIPDFGNIKAISAGMYHSLFLDYSAKVYSCGDNNSGQLGLGDKGSNTNRESPQLINNFYQNGDYFNENDVNFTAISAGGYHSLFLLDNGRVYSCGNNDWGQLGLRDFNIKNREIPENILGSRVTVIAISAGHKHSLFLDNNGIVRSCGRNGNGQLGLSDTDNRDTPLVIPMFNNIRAISAGFNHSLFLNKNGNVYSCGYNYTRDWRDKGYILSPELIPNFNNITTISAGYAHSLFLDLICPCGQIPNSNKTDCQWDNNFYQFYDHDLKGECTKITDNMSENNWNAEASSFLVPAGKSISVFSDINYGGSCISHTSGISPEIFNMPSSHDNNVQSIRINESCYKGRVACWRNCKTTGKCDWCGVGHKCCRIGFNGHNNVCSYWEGDTLSHVCIKSH